MGRATRLPRRCAQNNQPSPQCCPFVGVQGIFDHYPSCGGDDSRSWAVWDYPAFSSPGPFGELYEISGTYAAGAIHPCEFDELNSEVAWAITSANPTSRAQALGTLGPGGAIFVPVHGSNATGYPTCTMRTTEFSKILRFPIGNQQLHLVGVREGGPLGLGAAGGWFEITQCRRLYGDPLLSPVLPVSLVHRGPNPDFSDGNQRINGSCVPVWCPYDGNRTMWGGQQFVQTGDYRGKRVRVHATVSGSFGDWRFPPTSWQQPFQLSIQSAFGGHATAFPAVTRIGDGCAQWTVPVIFEMTLAAGAGGTRQAIVASAVIDHDSENRLRITQIEVTPL